MMVGSGRWEDVDLCYFFFVDEFRIGMGIFKRCDVGVVFDCIVIKFVCFGDF